MPTYTDPKWLLSVKSWLRTKTTVEAVEAETMRELAEHEDRFGLRPKKLRKTFGFAHDSWETLKARMQPGDELWTYRSEPASWMQLAGRAGYALVRNGEVIDEIVTVLS